jgi:hypothetical protein
MTQALYAHMNNNNKKECFVEAVRSDYNAIS